LLRRETIFDFGHILNIRDSAQKVTSVDRLLAHGLTLDIALNTAQ
jgi:hypothetical protein